MALGSDVTPALGAWAKVIQIGGMALADSHPANRITNPTGQITDGTRNFLVVPSGGKFLRLSMAYPVTLGPPADLDLIPAIVIQCFGYNSADPEGEPHALSNLNGQSLITIDVLPETDIVDGTMKFTFARPNQHTIDCDGCPKVLVGLAEALRGDSCARVLLAYLRGKVIG